MIKSKRGQSILEYVIVLTVIIAAVIAGSQLIKKSVSTSLENTAKSIEAASSKLPQ
jgi:uncharacterized protein (UPF0333 family)